MPNPLQLLEKKIHDCTLCPRLRAHCEAVAKKKRRAYQSETYWGKPVSGWGDPKAQLFVLGLAPAAHGANRTGRIFTGDRSGDWLYRALHAHGFANQPESSGKNDGLKLSEAWVTCSVRCAPPQNRPSPREFSNCRPYLESEIELLDQTRVYLALGSLALQTLEEHFRKKEWVAETKKWKFKHGEEYHLRNGRKVFTSYHPSQQNTFTGKLTLEAFHSVFRRIRKTIDSPGG